VPIEFGGELAAGVPSTIHHDIGTNILSPESTEAEARLNPKKHGIIKLVFMT